MQHNKNPNGSEWNKWDIHVHTPASVLANEFTDNWDEYVSELFKKAISCGIVAIGITDYYFIDGYKKIKEEYLSDRAKMESLFSADEIEYIDNILVFPNIEFRIDKLVLGQGEKDLKWNKKVNYHLLLSDSIPIAAIEELIQSIELETVSKDGVKQSKPFTKSNLISLGETLQSQQSEFKKHSALFVGMNVAYFNQDKVTSLLESDKETFSGKYFFAIPSDEDLSQVDWSSQGHLVRKNLLRNAHMILSSNPNTVKFGLGQKHRDEKSFIDEFGALKPCVWGSDAHSFERLYEPDGKRYTWIKSAPTFEGFRQILYEPYDRVKIQENIPESKTPYLVIDKVRFVDRSDQNLFQPEWIHLNDNLNVVIGGKSSGKSLLLFHVAKAIDAEQVIEKALEVSLSYDDFSQDFDMEVLWKDGQTDKLSENEKNGQVTFVPQLYINHLAEENGRKQLHWLIQTILLQNEGFKVFYEEISQKREQCNSDIKAVIQKILSLRKAYQESMASTKSLGTQAQIEEEIKRLEIDIGSLRKQSGFSSIEEKEFQRLTGVVGDDEKRIGTITQFVTQLKKYKTQIDRLRDRTLSDIATEYTAVSGSDSNKIMERLSDDLRRKITEAFDEFNVETSVEITGLAKTNLEIQTRLETNKATLAPLQTKVQNQGLLVQQDKARAVQRQKLTDLATKTTELASIKIQGVTFSDQLFEHYSELLETYRDVLSKLQEAEFVEIGDGLKLKSKIIFNAERFYNSFTNLFDLRNPMTRIFGDRFDEQENFIFNLQQHVGNIKSVFEKLPKEEGSESLKLKTRASNEDLLIKLFDDYFEIDFTIEHKGDNILRMSPGKRGVVILQLILHISNASHPILIDQPEDNLDNRTIYHELKQFMKDKKKQRQIIIVTHNANLVVSTDAENVIVANQAGQQIGKDERAYKFEYISGPLENTFTTPGELGILFQLGVREHVCDILEGGDEAFLKRQQKYGLKI